MPTQQEMAAWAEAQYLREKLAKLEGKPYNPTSTAGARFEGQQEAAKWQEPFETHGRIVPPQHEGESLNVYRIRLGSMMQEYSPEWKGANLHEAPSFMLDKVLGEIRADALKPTSHTADIPPGVIREFIKRDESGRERHEFVSSDQKTTFINDVGPNSLVAQGVIGARRVVSRFFGRDRVGNISTATPVEKPRYAGRMPLHNGLPRSTT